MKLMRYVLIYHIKRFSSCCFCDNYLTTQVLYPIVYHKYAWRSTAKALGSSIHHWKNCIETPGKFRSHRESNLRFGRFMQKKFSWFKSANPIQKEFLTHTVLPLIIAVTDCLLCVKKSRIQKTPSDKGRFFQVFFSITRPAHICFMWNTSSYSTDFNISISRFNSSVL